MWKSPAQLQVFSELRMFILAIPPHQYISPVSQSCDVMEKESAVCWVSAGELQGGHGTTGPAPTHKSLLLVTHAVKVQTTI